MLENTLAIILISCLFLTVILVAGGYFGWKIWKAFLDGVKETAMTQKSLGMTIFEVKVPQNNDIDTKQADQMFSGFLGVGDKFKGFQKYTKARKFISCEIVAFKDNIKFYITCPNEIATLVDRQINGAYPSAEVIEVKEYNIFTEDAEVASAQLKLDRENFVPIRTYEDLASDTMATLTDAMSKLREGESAAFQMVISPAGTDWRNDAKKLVKDARKPGEDGKDNPLSKKYPDEILSNIDKKAEKSGFYTDIRLVVVSPAKELAKEHLQNMLSAFDQYTKESGNRFKKDDLPSSFVKDFIYRFPKETMILNTGELATIFHFPNKNIETPHIQWLLSRDAPAADFVTKKYGDGRMYLGQNRYRGQNKDIFILPEDRLRHTYVIGQTGTGKSKFLVGQTVRDIHAGRGVCFIDPHGSDVELILKNVPAHRVEDVIYFDPSDTERPIGLNMMEFMNPDQKTFVINEMLNIFDKLYDLKSTGGPIFEQYMRNSMLLLMEDVESGNTLMEISRVLADEEYRKFKLSKATNPEVIHFWEKQAEKAGGEAALQNVVPYITSKLTSFVANDTMRPIIAQQKSTIDFRWAMDNEKIILVNLSKGRIGEMNAYLLGMVIVGKLLAAALSREDTEESLRKTFYLYIDEFQNFLTDSIVTILSEARKYKLSLNIAHQFLGQLKNKTGDSKIRDSIFGNVGTKVVFRVGIEDAEVFKKEFDPIFTPEDIAQQPNLHAYMKLLVDGKYPPPFSLYTHFDYSPFSEISFNTGDEEIAQTIKQISRLRFGRDRDIVEKEIRQRAKNKLEVKKEPAGGGLSSLFGGGGSSGGGGGPVGSFSGKPPGFGGM